MATFAALGLEHALTYTVQELYPLPGNYRAHALSLNASGQAVGYSLSPEGDASATVWIAGIAHKLDHFVGPDGTGYYASGVARDINDAGQIVGWYAECNYRCGADDFPNTFSGGSSAIGWTIGPGVPPPTVSGICFTDSVARYVSTTGYVLENIAIVSPWLGEFCIRGSATLYESGIVETWQGLVYDPTFSETVILDPTFWVPAGERYWVVVPSCNSVSPAFAAWGYDESSGEYSGPPVPDAMKQAICDQFANDYVRDRLRNVHGQYIENTGDRAFLYTPVPDTDGDGVPDTVDQCPASAMSATVVLGSCDSGVNNFVATNGCTVIDNISSCKHAAQNPGSMTSCVAHYLNALVPTLLSGQEKGRIQGCLRGIR